MFAIDKSYLIAGWVEAVLWGIYTVLFFVCMYTIVRHPETSAQYATFAAVALYILATGHISLALRRLVEGFILYRDELDPILYFANISIRLNMAKDYIYISSMVLGDSVIVWRLFVVWGHNYWITVLPAILCISTGLCGYGAISQWLLPHPAPNTMVKWGTAMYVTSFVTNVVVTGLISGRIWFVARRSQSDLGSFNQYRRVFLMITESGVVIAAAKLIEFILFQLAPVDGIHGNNGMYIVYEAMPQLTGIVPTVIILTVSLGFTNSKTYTSVPLQLTAMSFSDVPTALTLRGSVKSKPSNDSTFASGGDTGIGLRRYLSGSESVSFPDV